MWYRCLLNSSTFCQQQIYSALKSRFTNDSTAGFCHNSNPDLILNRYHEDLVRNNMTKVFSYLVKYGLVSTSLLGLAGCFTFVAPHPMEQRVEFATLLAPEDPLVRSSVLIAGMGERRDQIVLCNGVYFAQNQVLTAGHCLRDGFTYFAFVPVQVKRQNPYTYIRLEPAVVARQVQHQDFVFKFEEGLVESDIGLVFIEPPDFHLLKPVSLLPPGKTLPPPQGIAWRAQSNDAFFAIDPQNLVEVSGYKFERDQIAKGLNLIRDSANYVGPMPHTQSLLVSLNPGTSIHRGVSGSGLFWQDGDNYYLAGIVSVYYPGINLLTATNVAEFRKWLRQQQKTSE